MKKFILLFLLAVISTASFATDPIKFGLTGGINLSNTSIDGAHKLGFNVGITSDIPIMSNTVYFSPSILYSERTYVFTYSESIYSEKETSKLSYIDMPLLIKLKTNSIGNSNIKLFTSFGPTLSYAIKMSWNGISSTEVFGQNSGTDYDMARINWAVGINVGAEFAKRFQISAGYNLGLTDMSTSAYYSHPKSRNAMLRLTFFL